MLKKYIRLRALEANDTPKQVHGVMYGNFIQRLAFSSGGFPQDVRIMNVESQKIYTFQVKGTFKSAKENVFCYYIAPGTYVILNYWYIQGKWYGGREFLEPIHKSHPNSGGAAMQDTSDLSSKYQYQFAIHPGSITYVGTWDFSQPQVTFRDEGDYTSTSVQRRFKKIDFKDVRESIPQ